MKKCVKSILAFAMIALLILCEACGGGSKRQDATASGTGESEAEESKESESGLGNGMTVGEAETEKSLYEYGLDIVALMAEMAGNEEYVGLYTSSSELKDMLSSVGAGDFSEPSAVYRIRAMEGAVSILDMADIDTLSDELRASVEAKLFSALATQINSMGGATSVAAASLSTAEMLFVSEELEENEIYLYVYENATPVAVSFMKGENGAVAARGMFILYDEFPVERMEEVGEFLGEFGVRVEEMERN